MSETAECTRCGKGRKTIIIATAQVGRSSFPFGPDVDHVCGDCLTDLEIMLQLSRAMGFVLGVMIDSMAKQSESQRRDEWLKSLEIVRSQFIVYNTEQNNRQAAVQALGLGEVRERTLDEALEHADNARSVTAYYPRAYRDSDPIALLGRDLWLLAEEVERLREIKSDDMGEWDRLLRIATRAKRWTLTQYVKHFGLSGHEPEVRYACSMRVGENFSNITDCSSALEALQRALHGACPDINSDASALRPVPLSREKSKQ